MSSLDDSVRRFLDQKRIAVAGVSRKDHQAPANAIFRKLRGAGYEVFPINPNATEIEGVASFTDLSSVPGGVEAVVVVTTPAVSETLVQQCVDLGIPKVWIHRSLGSGSLSEKAVALGRKHGLEVIPGACPMMYCEPVDLAHKCLRWFLGVTGKLPR